MSKKRPKLIIEISGGVLCGVYCDIPELDVILADFDDIRDGDRPRRVGHVPLEDMQSDIKEQLRRLQ